MLYLLYGVFCYAVFVFTITWSYGFVGDMVVPTTMDHGPALPPGQAVAIDMMLMMVFSLQHSMMARPVFKKVWTRVVPTTIERSTYVLAASVAMLALMKYWQPIPHVLWKVDTPFLRVLLRTISLLGLTFTIYASFLINHFELFGLRQVWLHFRKVEYQPPRFASSWIYHYIRAPLMLGFLVAFWVSPTLTVSRLLLACVSTVYMLVAIRWEERDLADMMGEDYVHYRRRTPMLFPWPRPRVSSISATSPEPAAHKTV